MLKENKGVTLVALVITIIVLLILAGVTLSMVIGNNGIFTKANDASNKTSLSAATDAVRMALLETQTSAYKDDNNYTSDFTVAKLVSDTTGYGKTFEDSMKTSGYTKATSTLSKANEYTIAADGEGVKVNVYVNSNHKNYEIKIAKDGAISAADAANAEK